MSFSIQNRRHLSTQLFEYITTMSYSALFSLWISLSIIWGVGYFLLAMFMPEHAPTQLIDLDPLHMLYNALYFSVITATSTGYGDITPHGFSKAMAAAQSIMALMVFATFVTKLVSHKQEVALQEVHRLTFEDVFHNIREGFYIIRKDCDRIIRDAQAHQSLTEDHWIDMTTAYRQAQTMVQEIPDFYASKEKNDGRYTLDKRREVLLHEAVNRTLRRINQMLDTLSANNVDWLSHEESLTELKGLIDIVHTTIPRWEENSPHEIAFEEILDLGSRIHQRIEKTVSKDA